MATIRKEILINRPADQVWEAVRDVGAVHERLVPGFVLETRMDGDARVVTFANGLVARELIVGIDDRLRRLAYASVGGRAKHHHASVEVLAEGGNRSRFVWTTDVLPDELAGPIGAMVEEGARAIQRTLERDTCNGQERGATGQGRGVA